MNNSGLEIERKYLIVLPDGELLKTRCDSSEIVQTYLTGGADGGSERVRKRIYDGGTVYTHTRKHKINALSREEHETEISESEYEALLKRADPQRESVYKTRYCLEYSGQLFEIDVYPFWRERAVMEIELEREDQPVRLPPEIEIVREITEDRRYTNSSIAKQIPPEFP